MRVACVAAVTCHHRDTDRTRRTGRLTRALAARGHEVTVYCTQWWSGAPRTFESAGVTYRSLALSTDDLAFGTRLPAAIRSGRPDVVHAVHDNPWHVGGAATAARASRVPLVVDWYDDPTTRGGTDTPDDRFDAAREAVTPWLRRRAARAPALVVVPSRTVERAVREFGTKESALRVVPNAVEFARIRETDPLDGGEIVYSRRLDADANLESLLLALAERRREDWTATVVGDGSERARYERQAADLRIDDRIEFVGERPLEERIGLFRNAHAAVHTARRTPFPTDLLRALACGCVGVVEYQTASAAHELVEGRPRGFRVTSEDELATALGDAARLPHKTIDESFDEFAEEQVVERYLDCFRAAIGGRSGLLAGGLF